MTSPATTVDNLLICQNSFADTTPIHTRRSTVCKAFFPHFDKHVLAPAIIRRIAGVKHALIVVGKAHLAHSRLCLLDISIRPGRSLGVVLNRSIFCRQTKSVKADGVKHVHPAHARMTSDTVAYGVVARVAHVQIARRIGKHLQHVFLGLRGVSVGLVGFILVPKRLPLILNGMGIVGRNVLCRRLCL